MLDTRETYERVGVEFGPAFGPGIEGETHGEMYERQLDAVERYERQQSELHERQRADWDRFAEFAGETYSRRVAALERRLDGLELYSRGGKATLDEDALTEEALAMQRASNGDLSWGRCLQRVAEKYGITTGAALSREVMQELRESGKASGEALGILRECASGER